MDAACDLGFRALDTRTQLDAVKKGLVTRAFTFWGRSGVEPLTSCLSSSRGDGQCSSGKMHVGAQRKSRSYVLS
jgi:hypothetical protein